MTEEHKPYDVHHDEHDGTHGLERIGDVLHRLIDERGWPLTVGVMRANGHILGANDDSSHRDA